MGTTVGTLPFLRPASYLPQWAPFPLIRAPLLRTRSKSIRNGAHCAKHDARRKTRGGAHCGAHCGRSDSSPEATGAWRRRRVQWSGSLPSAPEPAEPWGDFANCGISKAFRSRAFSAIPPAPHANGAARHSNSAFVHWLMFLQNFVRARAGGRAGGRAGRRLGMGRGRAGGRADGRTGGRAPWDGNEGGRATPETGVCKNNVAAPGTAFGEMNN